MAKGIIKSFWKVGYPWVIMLSLALLYTTYEKIQSIGEEGVSIIIDIAAGCFVIALFVFIIRILFVFYKKIPQPAVNGGLRQENFSHQPWLYNKRIIILTARVERVIDFEMLGVLRRLVEHFKWVISSKEEPYLPRFYRRILLSSPSLESGQLITLFLDRALGRVNYSLGTWLQVQGQYIDQKSILYGFWGSRLTFYGGIYNPYGHNGFVRVLNGEPKPEELSDIRVIPKEKA